MVHQWRRSLKKSVRRLAPCMQPSTMGPSASDGASDGDGTEAQPPLPGLACHSHCAPNPSTLPPPATPPMLLQPSGSHSLSVARPLLHMSDQVCAETALQVRQEPSTPSAPGYTHAYTPVLRPPQQPLPPPPPWQLLGGEAQRSEVDRASSAGAANAAVGIATSGIWFGCESPAEPYTRTSAVAMHASHDHTARSGPLCSRQPPAATLLSANALLPPEACTPAQEGSAAEPLGTLVPSSLTLFSRPAHTMSCPLPVTPDLGVELPTDFSPVGEAPPTHIMHAGKRFVLPPAALKPCVDVSSPLPPPEPPPPESGALDFMQPLVPSLHRSGPQGPPLSLPMTLSFPPRVRPPPEPPPAADVQLQLSLQVLPMASPPPHAQPPPEPPPTPLAVVPFSSYQLTAVSPDGEAMPAPQCHVSLLSAFQPAVDEVPLPPPPPEPPPTLHVAAELTQPLMLPSCSQPELAEPLQSPSSPPHLRPPPEPPPEPPPAQLSASRPLATLPLSCHPSIRSRHSVPASPPRQRPPPEPPPKRPRQLSGALRANSVCSIAKDCNSQQSGAQLSSGVVRWVSSSSLATCLSKLALSTTSVPKLTWHAPCLSA